MLSCYALASIIMIELKTQDETYVYSANQLVYVYESEKYADGLAIKFTDLKHIHIPNYNIANFNACVQGADTK